MNITKLRMPPDDYCSIGDWVTSLPCWKLFSIFDALLGYGQMSMYNSVLRTEPAHGLAILDVEIRHNGDRHQTCSMIHQIPTFKCILPRFAVASAQFIEAR